MKPCPACVARNNLVSTQILFYVDPGPCRTCDSPYGSVGQIVDDLELIQQGIKAAHLALDYLSDYPPHDTEDIDERQRREISRESLADWLVKAEIVTANRMTPHFVTKQECPGCDGEGSLSTYWTCKRCREVGGYMKRNKDGFPTYFTADGKEMEFKTVGGPCPICGGSRIVLLMEVVGND